MSASTQGDPGPRRDATGAATASVTVRSDRGTSRGMESIGGSLMVAPYELTPTPSRHRRADGPEDGGLSCTSGRMGPDRKDRTAALLAGRAGEASGALLLVAGQAL